MSSLVDHTNVIEVPRGAGSRGYLHVVGEIFKLPKVQDIHIGAGKVTYVQRVPRGEAFEPLKADFATVMPHAVIRNGDVRELQLPAAASAAYSIAAMFNRATQDRLHPVAFVGSSTSVVWEWHEKTVGLALAMTDELYGLPFYDDPHYEDATLLLCAASSRGAPLEDTQRTYKILMPERSTT